MAEAARAEVDADPDDALFVGEQVDIVVAGADRPELFGGKVVQLALRRGVGGADGVQHGMVDRVVVAAPDAERDPVDDRVHDAREVGRDVVVPEVGANRLVAAADVVADP